MQLGHLKPQDRSRKDLSKVNCYNCDQMGHYAKDCKLLFLYYTVLKVGTRCKFVTQLTLDFWGSFNSIRYFEVYWILPVDHLEDLLPKPLKDHIFDSCF